MITSTQVTLSWSRPPTPNGVIANYTVTYSNETSTDISMMVDYTEMVTGYIVDGLNEFTVYVFRVTATTAAGTGPEAVLNLTTAEDSKHCNNGVELFVRSTYNSIDLYCTPPHPHPHIHTLSHPPHTHIHTLSHTPPPHTHTHTVPSAPPQMLNATFINSTALSVNWLPPPEQDQNGVILDYQLTYQVNGTTDAIETITVSELSTTIEGLEIFTLYLVSVRARTVVGLGPTAVVVARTDSTSTLL